MAETVAELLVKIGADVESLKKGSAEMNALLSKLQADSDKASGGFSKLQATTVSLASAVSLAKDAYRLFSGVLSTVSGVAVEFASAAGDQEDALLQLRNALELTGNASDEVVAAFEAQANALQNQSRFADEAVNSVQALLTRFGVVPEDMAAATQAVADFASATGQDLATAAEAVGRAVEGQARGLKAYGITLEDTGSKSANLANAVAALNDRFGGSAAASVANMRGQIAVLSNAFGEIQETLGGFITQSAEGQRIVAFVTDEIVKLNAILGENQTSFQEITEGALRQFVLFVIDAAGAVISVGGAVETVGKKIAAFAGVLTLPFKSEGFKAALADLTGTVETESDKMLGKLAEFRARFEAFGNETPPKLDGVADSLGVIPPKLDEVAAGSEKLATSSGVLVEATDRTAKSLEEEADALEQINERLSDLDFEAAIASFSDLGKAVAEEQRKIQKAFEDGKISLEQFLALSESAADRVRGAFAADFTAKFREDIGKINLELDIFNQITGRSATELQKLEAAQDAANQQVQVATQALIEAKVEFGPFSEEALVAQNELRQFSKAAEEAANATQEFKNRTQEATSALEGLNSVQRAAEKLFFNLDRGTVNVGVAMEEVNAQLAELVDAADPEALAEFADEMERLAEETRRSSSELSPFATFVTKNANDLFAASQQARNYALSLTNLSAAADRAADSAAGLASVTRSLDRDYSVTFHVLATGSPTLDFSEYFAPGGYAEKKIAGLEPAPLTIRVGGGSSGDAASSTAGDVWTSMRQVVSAFQTTTSELKELRREIPGALGLVRESRGKAGF